MTPELEIMDKRITELNDSEWQVLVFKGFSNSVYNEYSSKFIPLEPMDIFNVEGKINLSRLKDIIPDLIGKLFQIKNKNKYIILFESFRLVTRNINLDIIPSNFIIIENNLYDQYLNPTDTVSPDFEKQIDSNQPLPDGDIISELFSSCITIGKKQYIQYNDGLDEIYKNVKYFPLIEVGDMPNVNILPSDQFPENAIVFKLNDEKLHLLKEVWLNKYPDEPISFLVDQSILVTEESKLQIRILSAFFQYHDDTIYMGRQIKKKL